MKGASTINIVAAVLRAKLGPSSSDEQVWKRAQEFVSSRCQALGHEMGKTYKEIGCYRSKCLYCDFEESWE